MGHSTDSIPSKKPRKLKDLKEGDKYWLTFENLFSKAPDVGPLFTQVFESKPGWIIPVYDSEANSLGYNSTSVKPTSSYILFIDNSGRWVKEDILELGGSLSQISELGSNGSGRKFRVLVNHEGHDNFWPVLNTHRSPYINHALIVPALGSVNQYRRSSLSILYALSIVVRYRPSLWRRIQEGDLDHM